MKYLKHVSNKIISIINIIYFTEQTESNRETRLLSNSKIIITIFNILTNDTYNLITVQTKNNVRKINNNSVNSIFSSNPLLFFLHSSSIEQTDFSSCPKPLQECCLNRVLAPAVSCSPCFTIFTTKIHRFVLLLKRRGVQKTSLLKFQEAFSSFGVRCAMTCLVYIWNWG